MDIPYSPIEIVSAIRKHGWTMPHSEHDAHEFFHVVLTSIEEEITKNSPLVIPSSSNLSHKICPLPLKEI